MMVFEEARFADLYPEMWPLLLRNWRETGVDQDTVPLEPNVALYQAIEGAGNMLLLAARVDGVLVGYACYFIMPSLHHPLRVAQSDVVYLLPEYRRGSAGLRLLRAVERALAARGVDVVSTGVKAFFANAQGRGQDVLMRRLGYRHTENVFMKRVGRHG